MQAKTSARSYILAIGGGVLVLGFLVSRWLNSERTAMEDPGRVPRRGIASAPAPSVQPTPHGGAVEEGPSAPPSSNDRPPADLASEPTLRVFGAVTTSDGAELAGVSIWSGRRRQHLGQTDERGTYSVELRLPAGNQPPATYEDLLLVFSREGYHDHWEELKTAGREGRPGVVTWRAEPSYRAASEERQGEMRLDVELDAVVGGVTVTGTVRAPNGAAASGEMVHLESGSRSVRYETKTDPSGAFRIVNVPTADDYVVTVEPRGALRAYQRRGVRVASDIALDVRLEPYVVGQIGGRTVTPSGAVVPGVPLSVELPAKPLEGNVLSLTTDASGEFFVEEFPASEVVFEVRLDDGVTKIHGAKVDVGTLRRYDLVVDVGDATLRGEVRDGLDQPVEAHVGLVWYRRGDDGLTSTSIRETRTAKDGRFVFTGLSAQPHRLSVEAPEFETIEETVSLFAGATDHRVRLRPRVHR